MQIGDWVQLGVFLLLILLLTKPLGIYLTKVLDPAARTFLDPVFRPVERFIYRMCRVDPLRVPGLHHGI
jgi:K+-transporting ATPase ATPase A chain